MIMLKYTVFLLLISLIMTTQARVHSRRSQVPKIFRRDPICGDDCTGDNQDCPQRCQNHPLNASHGPLHVVCEDNQCYCGFPLQPDN
jgi:hypothetical protein